MAEDYYSVLGVDRGAPQSEIEKAYRDQARKYHPDLNPDDKTAKTKFQEVQRAFEVLKDPEKREMYDRYGSSFESMGSGGPGGNPFTGGGQGGAEFDFSEFFGDRFGGGQGGGGFEDIFRNMGAAQAGQRTRRPQRGRDIAHPLTVPFATAVLGGKAQLNVQRGDGKVEPIEVTIPAGIENGKKLRLKGQGEKSPGADSGDILITVLVSPHPCFTRQRNNLEIHVPVSVAEAALGAKVDIPSPRGTISLTIPPGTSSGAKLRIKGQGVTPDGAPPGDLIAEVLVVMPDKMDEEAEKLFRQLGELQKNENPRQKLSW